MTNKFIMRRGILLTGAALTLTACGGAGTNAPAVIPAPPVAPVVVPSPPPVEEKVVLTESLTTRQNGVDYYQNGDYIAYVNNWGAESMGLAKTDYSQKVEITKGSFPNKTLITWNYPVTPHGDGAIVYGYPGIAWGKTTLSLTGYNTNNALGRIGDVAEFKQTYDITLTGDPKYNNLMTDMWMWDNNTGKIAGEITFNVKPSEHILYWGNPNNYFGQQPGAHSFQFAQGGVNYNMLVSTFSPNGGVETIPGAKMIIIIPIDGSQTTAGTIDWTQVFKILLDAKDIDPAWLIKGVEMGVEVQAGKGSMLVNNFSVAFKLRDQKIQGMVVMVAESTAAATTAASQINAATLQQILAAAVSNPKTTYTFGQGNAGVGNNIAVSKNLSFGTSSVFHDQGYTMASNLMWRNKNTYAILAGGSGKLRMNNTNIGNTFAAFEAGSRLNTKLASIAPYTRLGYTQYHSPAVQYTNRPMVNSIALDSLKLSGGMKADVPITNHLWMRLAGEVSNEFLGIAQAKASFNRFSSTAPINIRGMEYTGSINLSAEAHGIRPQLEIGTRKNHSGTNNYATIGMRMPL